VYRNGVQIFAGTPERENFQLRRQGGTPVTVAYPINFFLLLPEDAI